MYTKLNLIIKAAQARVVKEKKANAIDKTMRTLYGAVGNTMQAGRTAQNAFKFIERLTGPESADRLSTEHYIPFGAQKIDEMKGGFTPVIYGAPDIEEYQNAVHGV